MGDVNITAIIIFAAFVFFVIGLSFYLGNKAKSASAEIPALLRRTHLELQYLDQLATDLRLATNRPDIDDVHTALVEAGYADMLVYITEGGWNDHPRWTKAVQPSQRAAFTSRAYEKVLAEWPWAEAAILWAFRYPRPANTFQDYFTFVTTDFMPKPIYYSVQRYARGEGP